MLSKDITLNQVNTAASVVSLSLSFVNLVLGAIGLMCNVFVFTRPTLRRQPCSLYFFASTCYNFYVILVVIPVRILSNNFNIDSANYNLGCCKIETFSFYTARTISCWLIASASIDRFLHSSGTVSIRQLSSLKTAKLIIVIISVTVPVLYSHMIGYFEITNVPDRFGNIVPVCNGQIGIYRKFLGFWYMVWYSFFPSFLMLLFGSLTLNNLRQRRQIVPRASQNNHITRRTDIQLLRMLTAQILVIIICTLPFSIYLLYSTFTATLTKSTLRIAQENLAFQIVGAVTYFAHSSSFYLYTLTGTIFRNELIKRIRRYWHPNRNSILQVTNERGQIAVLQRNEQHNNNVTRKTTI
jgi:hypothetical protein